MSGWVPMQSEWWATVRATIPKPWPKEAACMDLRWHMDRAQERDGWRAIRLPGRPMLSADWGWTDWAVKCLLRDELSWRDANSASEPPAGRQRAASEPPAATTENADTLQETASEPPADRQPAASKPPRARSSAHNTHHTPHVERNARAPDARPNLAEVPTGQPIGDLERTLGVRPDLLRLLLVPLDPSDPPIRDLDTLRRTSLDDLQHRRGMGPKRAKQLAEVLDDAGLPLIAERSPQPTRGSPRPANWREKPLFNMQMAFGPDEDFDLAKAART